MPEDMTLQAMVMDELAWAPNVDAAHIGVAARNGVVTLSGIVGSLAAAWSAPGVTQVDDQLIIGS